VEAQWFGFSSFVSLKKDGAHGVIRCIYFQFERFFRIRVYQYGFCCQDVDDPVEWLDYVGKARNKGSMVV
jgi:hypothetical protein